MPENETPQILNEQDNEQNVDYVAALQELREKSVPKEQYEKLKADNAKLLKSLINGETIDTPPDSAHPDVAQLRKDLFSGEGSLSNLEYVSKVLDLRDSLIESGEADPFLPTGHEIAPTAEDREAAARVAKVMRECVEGADGDSNLFTSLLMRQTIDVKMPLKK